MLDDLRSSTQGNFDEPEMPENVFVPSEGSTDKKFLGMTAVERMFLSLFFFMNVLIIGLALLLATGRIVL